jgi:murein biosynthesis integral membrane protein MurJ
MKNILFSAIIVSFGLFIGRLSGFLREIIIANNFGATENSDFIVLLLTTPDLLVNLLMGGAMSMALIPEFKKLNEKDSKLLYKQVTSIIIVFGLTICIISYPFSENLISTLALGMDEEFIYDNKDYFFLSLLALPFSLSTGASLAYLNAKERFTITSLSTLIVNLTIIIFIFLSSLLDSGFILISMGLVLASLFRWLSQVLAIGGLPIAFNYGPNLVTRELLSRYFYALATGGVIFLLPVIIRTVASTDGGGALSLVNYTIKLVELPLIILSTVFSVIFLPKLSAIYSSGKEGEFLKLTSNIFCFSLFMSLLVTSAMTIYTSTLVETIYGWGALTHSQLSNISEYLKVYVVSLPFQCMNGILLAVFSSRRDTKRPFIVTTLLGGGTFYFLISVHPPITHLFYYLITFYVLTTIFFLIALRFRHDITPIYVDIKIMAFGMSLLLLIFIVLYTAKGFIVTLEPVIGSLLIGTYVISMLVTFVLMFRLMSRRN